MPFFDSLFGAVKSYSPAAQAGSTIKWIIGAIVLLILFLVLWSSRKDGMLSSPSAADRVFGVVTRNNHT